MQRKTLSLMAAIVAASGLALTSSLPIAHASSHREAPLIAQDPEADNTDLYAFVSNNSSGQKVLNVLSNFIGLEDPGGGPNYTQFSPDVRYEIHIENDATLNGGTPVFTGHPNMSFYFMFKSNYQNAATFLTNGIGSAGVGPIAAVGDGHQNLTQTYTVTQVTGNGSNTTDLSTGMTLKVPPPNTGHATPLYNVGNDPTKPAKQGAATAGDLDPYTTQSIYTLPNGIKVFAGPRLDPFYADVQGIFDLLSVRNPGENTLAGYNVHEIALQIPVSMLTTGSVPIVGIYSAASRRTVEITPSHYQNQNGPYTNFYNAGYNAGVTGYGTAAGLSGDALAAWNAGYSAAGGTPKSTPQATWRQVSRLGNPLFNEVLTGVGDKDYWNSVSPAEDPTKFHDVVDCPQVAGVLNLVLGTKLPKCGYSVLDYVFLPDLLKVDLSTGPVRLESDPGFSRLSNFGGDTINSPFQGKATGSGWPLNGRRLGDDVVDLALTAIASGPSLSPLNVVGDNVDSNGLPYNHVFPFEQTPANGWLHKHIYP